MQPLNVIMVISGLIDGLVAGAVLCFRCLSHAGGPRRRWPIQLPDVVLAVLAATASLCLKLLGLLLLGYDFFALMRVTYFDCVVVLPLLGVAVLVHRGSRPQNAAGPGITPGVGAFALLSILAAPVGYYATFVEPYDLRVERPTVALDALPAGCDPVTVAVMADIQTAMVGTYEHRAVDAAMAAKPDLIVIPGDVYEATEETLPERADAFRNLLNRLEAPGGVYVVTGDCDTRTEMREIVKGTHVRWLDDEVVDTVCRGIHVRVAGVGLNTTSPAARTAYRELASGPDDAVRLLLAHRPVAVAHCLAEGTRPDIVLAGHTHGGQIAVPGFGPIITLSALPREHASGLSRYEGVPLYVSRGIGVEGPPAPPVRLFCPPEVTILSLIGPDAEPTRLASAGW